jgi:hypothetical protein
MADQDRLPRTHHCRSVDLGARVELVEAQNLEMENIMMNCIPPCRNLGMLGACPAGSVMDASGEACGPVSTVPGTSNSSWIQNLIGGAVGTVQDIFKAKNTVRGVLTQTSPGVFQYVQPTGSNVTLPVNVSPAGALGVNASASSGMGMILLAGAGVFLVFMLAKKGN